MDDAPPRTRGLALIGPRGSGKSTVGRLVAERLDRPFVDADRVLEERAGRSIAAIFAEAGEPAFRDFETATLRALAAEFPDAVLATGGGVVLREVNRAALRDFGLVVGLTAGPARLAERLAADPAGRPALTSAGLLEEVAAVLDQRMPLYEALADVLIDTTDRPPEAVAREVVARWRAIAAVGGAA